MIPADICILQRWMDAKEFPQKDYYKVLDVDYDAADEIIRLNYRRLALKWHPDKHMGDYNATAKFQEINEAYSVLSDPTKRLDYDISGNYEVNKYTLREYLTRFKGMILTCNGLGISHSPKWTQQLVETEHTDQENIFFPLCMDGRGLEAAMWMDVSTGGMAEPFLDISRLCVLVTHK